MSLSNRKSLGNPAPDIGEAYSFLQLLDPAAASFTFQTVDDNKERLRAGKDDAKRRGATYVDPLAHIMHGPLLAVWKDLGALNNSGAGIFVTVNRTDGKGRKLSNIQAVRAVWGEFDHGWPDSLPLPPSIRAESSPSRFHAYWLVDGLTPEDHAGAMARLVQDYGSDRNAADLARVLRLPGFFHRKGKPFLVMATGDGRRYTREEILAAFPAPQTGVAAPPASPAGEAPRTYSLTLEGLRSALQHVPGGSRIDWLRVGMAIKHQFGESGFDVWDDWAEGFEGYDGPKDQRYQWDSFERKPGEGKLVTVGTVLHMAHEAGWKGAGTDAGLEFDAVGDVATKSRKRGNQTLWMADTSDPKVDWAVQRLLPVGGIGFLAAESTFGKTFQLIRLMMCLGHGVPYFGRSIPSPVGSYLLAGEGAYGMPRRFEAALTQFPGGRLPVAWEDFSGNLRDTATRQALVERVRAADATMRKRYGMPIGFLGIDTWQKVLAGKDDDDAASVGIGIKIMQWLAAELSVSVLSTVHFGKDPRRGIRGSSAFKGDIDLVLAIPKRGNLVISKARDAADGPLGRFALETVQLGTDDDGAPKESMVVREGGGTNADAEFEAETDSTAAALLVGCIADTIRSWGKEVEIPETGELVRAVTWKAARGRFRDKWDGKPSAFRSALHSARKSLGDEVRFFEVGEDEWCCLTEV